MDIWSILKIDKTKDRNKIKEAYIEKLAVVHPEDDPEGFKLLRSAYEEALELSKRDEVENNNDPIEVWGRNIEEIYNKFSRRVDENQWKELFQDKVIFALDTKEAALDKLMDFLMDYFYIPQYIWQIIDSTFSLQDRADELYEKYPEDFISFVLNKIQYSDGLRYDLFEIDDSKDYETWFNLYYKIRRELNNNEVELAKDDILEIRELNIGNPYLDLLEIRYFIITDMLDEAEKMCNFLYEKYPDNISVLYSMAEVKWSKEEYAEAEKYYSKCLEISPDDFNCKVGLADVYFEKGEIEKSKEIFVGLLAIDPYDDYVKRRVFDVNDKLIDEYKEKKDVCIKDSINIAWCYFENLRYEEAIETILSLEPVEDKDMKQCLDVLGSAKFSMKQFEEAFKYYNLWLEAELEDTKDIKDEEDNKRIAYLYSKIGRISFNLNKFEVAIEFYDKAIELSPHDAFYLQCKGEALNKIGRFEETVSICEKALEIDSNEPYVYIIKAYALFLLGYFNDALECCENAINIYPYYTEPYLIKMKTFNIYDEYEEMINIANIAEEYNIATNEILIYKVIALRRLSKLEEAEKINNEILSKLNDQDDNKLKSKVYYEFSYLEIVKENFNKALEYINLAIKYDDNEIDNYYLRAYIYKSTGKHELALTDYKETVERNGNEEFSYYQCGCISEELNKYDDAVYYFTKVLEINPQHMYANGRLSEMYEELGEIDSAIKYVSIHLEIHPTAYHYINRGLYYAKQGKGNEAINDYHSALEIENTNPYAYNNIGYEYEKQRNYKLAIEFYEKAIRFCKDRDFTNPYTNIAKTYLKTKNIDKAMEYYDIAIEKFPNNDCFYEKKASLLKGLRYYDEAIEWYKKGLEIKGSDKAEYYENIADACYAAGRYQQCIKWNEKIIDFNTESNFAYREIGKCYCELGNIELATKYHLKQLEYCDDYEDEVVKVGRFYMKIGDIQNANKYFNIAVEEYMKQDLSTSVINYSLGAVYKEMGMVEEAFKYLENAKSAKLCNKCKFMGCSDAYFKIAELYKEEENYEKAIENLNIAYELDPQDYYLELMGEIEEILKL